MVRRDLDRSLDVCTTAELTLRCAFRTGSVQLTIRRTGDFGSVQLTIAGVPFAARDTGYVLGHFRGFPAQPVHAWPPLRNILTPSIGSGPCIWVMVEVSCQAPPNFGVGRRRAWQRTSGGTTSQRQCSSFLARGSQTRSEFVRVFLLDGS